MSLELSTFNTAEYIDANMHRLNELSKEQLIELLMEEKQAHIDTINELEQDKAAATNEFECAQYMLEQAREQASRIAAELRKVLNRVEELAED
jgi:hypothetical protein